MLRGLMIRDMVLIDRLDMEFQPGLNVLTGETGAGKSILLDCLGFVLGWRGRSDLLRSGAAQGEVVASFDVAPNHPVLALLTEAGLADGTDLILRRINTSDGRKQAFVNDRRCTGETLRRISNVLVELHGQHDDRGLLNVRGHRALVDDFGGLRPDLSAVRKAWQRLQAAQSDLQALRDSADLIAKDHDYLVHALDEMTTLAPKAGEDADLDTQRRLMQSAVRIRTDMQKAAQALGPQGAEGAMTDAARWLQDVETKAEGRLNEPIAALSRALNELADSQRGIEDCLQALAFEPHALDQCEERLFAIRALARKHNVRPDDLAALTDELSIKLAAIKSSEGDIADLELAEKAAQVAYDGLAEALGTKRRRAAAQLDRAMATELKPLKLERAVFETKITKTAANADGTDDVRFTVATNPGAPAGAINKIASGGELSRFLLALKVCLSSRAGGLTMIFDEIDRGVGGATADAVGRRLAALAKSGQILVVTHSPQVAALGTHHWLIEKSVIGGQTRSNVTPLDTQRRQDEIARMLAGDTITAEARAAAGVLLDVG